MTLPNFLVIGAAKSGTTALYEYLKPHPQIFMSEIKEPHFFAMQGQEVVFHGPKDQEYVDQEFVNTQEAYEALFADVVDEVAIGEASAFYLYYAERTAPRIRAAVPDAKLIVLLRNPTKRAYSSYTHMMRDVRETMSFEDALKQEETRIQAGWFPIWHYVNAGFYYENLKRFFDLFPQEQIRVYLQDDFKKDSSAIVRDVYEYLGVDPDFQAEMGQSHNVSYIPKRRNLQRVRQFLLQPNNPVKDAIKPLLPAKMRKRMVRSVANRIEEANFERIAIPPETHAHLIHIFQDDILKLQTLIDRDLSAWLKV